MTYYEKYEHVTGRIAPTDAWRLEPLFNQIESRQSLPPRGQQAVNLGLPAHSLNDSTANPALYNYYQWVLRHYFQNQTLNELTAKLIGMAFVCNHIFKTDLPQPLSLNPWQRDRMLDYPLATDRAVIVENNGIFALLATQHPNWPLINQGGNDFQTDYVTLMQRLEDRGVRFTYLGDLDAKGIQIADTLFCQLKETSIEDFLALQTESRVSEWLTLMGHPSVKRTKRLTVKTPALQKQLTAISIFGKYVEQEQLTPIYEQLITEWLNGEI